MSECVVRMNFPKRCYDCDMADGLTCMATGGTYGRDVPKMTWISGKPEWCPIVCALPENHGRLVDADANFLSVIHLNGGGFVNCNTTIAERLGEEDMRSVKVIVQAEAERSEA